MSTTLILFDQVATLINASTAVAAGSAFALPSRAAVLGVQMSVDVNAGNFTVVLQVSIDGTHWFTIATITQADLVSANYFATLSGIFAAKFVRGNVTTNSIPHAVTLQLLAKAAF